MGKEKMVQLNGIYVKIFPTQEIILAYRNMRIRVVSDIYDDIIIYYRPGKNLKKLVKYFEDFHVPYSKVGREIEVIYEPWYFNVSDIKDLIEKLKEEDFLDWFLDNIIPPFIL
ncbi:hypothetical protein [Sulfuracidifex metallicus]|uniref:hypothetical protein n=1 Tax=Sulfuracidifex metallicus TaxID=47303 RepID=UPI002272EAEA|nr:hypothetical protein [Sulfuracidifex metallicus]MCY0851091.1 hypothetical protein [Sulfuracidifex metallicus]